MGKTNLKSLILLILLSAFVLKSQSPNWQWAKSAGGSYRDKAHAICADGSGNIYTTGSFVETATFGTFTLSTSGGQFNNDIFVAKYNPSGVCQWAVKAGSTGANSPDEGMSICIDNSGDLYVTGYFNNTIVFGTFSLTSSGGEDIFVAKYNSGGIFQWARKAGGTVYDRGLGITSDPANNIYVTGNFGGTSSFNSVNVVSQSVNDVFIAKYNSSGTIQWVEQAGLAASGTWGQGNSIDLDNSGNIYLTGVFTGTLNFDSQVANGIGGYDIFIAKYDLNANCIWVKVAGALNGGWDEGQSISVDAAGNSFITGEFKETITFDGTTNLTATGSSSSWEIFVAKYNSNGVFKWARKAGGSSHDFGYGVTNDQNSNCYVTGFFYPPATFDSITINNSNAENGFIAKYDSLGNIQWVNRFGGPLSTVKGRGICIDNSTNLSVVGDFNATAYFGTIPLTSTGPSAYTDEDIFVAKLNSIVGIEEISKLNSVSVFPNPFNNKITIEYNGPEKNFQVYNTLGLLVHSSTTENEKTEIDLSKQPSGIYFIRIGNYTKKLVKE